MTKLSRDLAAVLGQVRHERDSFLIEQEGEAVAALEPVASEATWSDLAKCLRDVAHPDPTFADHLETVQHRPGQRP